MQTRSADFDCICELVRRHSGVVLEAGKAYLAESRLMLLMRREGLQSLQALVVRLRSEPYNGLHQEVVEAMTTHETSFFRDNHPFEALQKNVLPELLAARSSERRLNIWCAACSSGQEPYSIAIIIREHFPMLAGWHVTLLATDFSKQMLERAREGRYPQAHVNRGLAPGLLSKYFHKTGTEWRVNDDIRRMVDFRDVNIAEAWPALPRMDIVLMRNVLIYFELETRRAILSRAHSLLEPHGFLFLGSAESTINLSDSFECVLFDKATCYRPCKQQNAVGHAPE